METTTIKRNGIVIVFPAKEHSPIKGNIVKPVVRPAVAPVQIRSISDNPVKRKYSRQRKNSPYIGKRCWHCGDPVWKSDVNYCWECYKYENYESK